MKLSSFQIFLRFIIPVNDVVLLFHRFKNITLRQIFLKLISFLISLFTRLRSRHFFILLLFHFLTYKKLPSLFSNYELMHCRQFIFLRKCYEIETVTQIRYINFHLIAENIFYCLNFFTGCIINK